MYPASIKILYTWQQIPFWLVCLVSLYGWFLYSENFHSSQYTSHPVILREAEGEVAESIIQKKPRPQGEGGPSQTVGEDRGRALSPTPHPPWRVSSP